MECSHGERLVLDLMRVFGKAGRGGQIGRTRFLHAVDREFGSQSSQTNDLQH